MWPLNIIWWNNDTIIWMKISYDPFIYCYLYFHSINYDITNISVYTKIIYNRVINLFNNNMHISLCILFVKKKIILSQFLQIRFFFNINGNSYNLILQRICSGNCELISTRATQVLLLRKWNESTISRNACGIAVGQVVHGMHNAF